MLLPNSEIPNDEKLFRYCNPLAFPEGQDTIPSSVYNDSSLSCDWAKLRDDPATSFHVRDEGMTRVISIKVDDEIKNPRNPRNSDKIEPAWKQAVVYFPIRAIDDPIHGENIAHSLINGPKRMAVTDALRKHSVWFDVYQ